MNRHHLLLLAAGAFVVGLLIATAVPAADLCEPPAGGADRGPDWCMPRHMPPARLRSMPADARVICVPLQRIVEAGRHAYSGDTILGAADVHGRTVLMPRRGDLPDGCWQAIWEHEAAHLRHWRHP